MRKKTKEVINSVQEILGFTELHPEVVQKILDLYAKVESHDSRMDAFSSVIEEMKGLNLADIEKMIDYKFNSILSRIKENSYYILEV